MTEVEQLILNELRSLKNHVDTRFDKVDERFDKVDDKANRSDRDIVKLKVATAVDRTKNGTFIAGMTFVFTGLFTLGFGLLQHYFKNKF